MASPPTVDLPHSGRRETKEAKLHKSLKADDGTEQSRDAEDSARKRDTQGSSKLESKHSKKTTKDSAREAITGSEGNGDTKLQGVSSNLGVIEKLEDHLQKPMINLSLTLRSGHTN